MKINGKGSGGGVVIRGVRLVGRTANYYRGPHGPPGWRVGESGRGLDSGGCAVDFDWPVAELAHP
jgi:hypothetical protein